jgi:hypothetical protein
MGVDKINKFNPESPFSVFATSTLQAIPSLMETFGDMKQDVERNDYTGDSDPYAMPEFNSPYESNPWDRVGDAKQEGNSRALNSTMTGAKIGLNPALMAATGGLSVLAGAAIGGTVGLIGKGKRVRKAKKAAEDIETLKSSYVNSYNTDAQNSAEMISQRNRSSAIKDSFTPSIYNL